MPKLAPILPKKLAKILEKTGFKLERQKGSHATFTHPDGRVTTIPMHSKPIKVGLLNKIIKHQLQISREKFEELL